MKKKRNKSSLKRKFKVYFSIKSEYKKSFEYIKDSRNFIYSAILLFCIFLVLGLFFEDLINSLFKALFNMDLNAQILNYIQNLLDETEGMGGRQLMGFIFFNNLQSSFFGMMLGVLFGIFPLIALLSNGYLLGFVAMISVKTNGFLILWRILPHGIFELPAVFISLGLGLRLGMYVFAGKEKDSFKTWFLNSLRVFLLVILPLLIIAALIEGALIALSGV